MPRRSTAFLLAALVAMTAGAALVQAGCPFTGRSRHRVGPTQEERFMDLMAKGAAKAAAAAPAPPSDQMAGQLPGANNLSDPMVQMNDVFHTDYSTSGVLVRPDPIAILENDYLVLLKGSQRWEFQATPMLYHNLKMVSHIPLAIFMILFPITHAGNTQLDAATWKRLEAYYSSMQVATPTINENRFAPGAQLQRQWYIANGSFAYVEKVLKANQTSVEELTAFTRSMNASVQLNLDEAAAGQVQYLHNAHMAIKAMLSADEWERLAIVVTTSHMARPQNLASQYFSRYYNVDIFQNERFITLEELSTESHVLTLLDTHVTDYGIATYFFDAEYRMHEDALCFGAKLALDVMFPATANSTIGCFPTNTPLQ